MNKNVSKRIVEMDTSTDTLIHAPFRDGGKNYNFTNSFRLTYNKILFYYKYILFFILVGLLLYYSANSDSGFCDDTIFFYKNNVNCKIIKIDTFDYKTKGKGIYYYFKGLDNVFLYKTTQYLHKDYPSFQIGDSISKEANTEDFRAFRNGILIFEGINLPCQCKYCDPEIIWTDSTIFKEY